MDIIVLLSRFRTYIMLILPVYYEYIIDILSTYYEYIIFHNIFRDIMKKYYIIGLGNKKYFLNMSENILCTYYAILCIICVIFLFHILLHFLDILCTYYCIYYVYLTYYGLGNKTMRIR